MATKAEKLIDRRITSAYVESCSGVEIDMMDIGSIFQVGRAAILEGADDASLKVAIAAYVETIRKN